MTLLLAGLPVLVSTLLILVASQSALRAGAAGLAVALVVAMSSDVFHLAMAGLFGALHAGVMNTLNVSYVLFGGVLLYQVLSHSGALEVLASGVVKSIPDDHHRLFGIVFGVSVFFESATGFGVGIVVVAPLFLALGYTPLKSAVLALIGQCAVPWGALAIGTVLASTLSGIPEARLGALSALISVPYIVASGFVALWVGGILRVAQLHWIFIYSAILLSALWFFSVTAGIELAGCLSGCVVVLFAIVASRKSTLAVAVTDCGVSNDKPGVWISMAPFMVLLVSLLVTRLLRPVREALSLIQVPVTGDFQFAPLYHAGFWLVFAAITAVFVLQPGRDQLAKLIPAAARQWWLATLAVGGFLCFGRVMLDSGMTQYLAREIAQMTGTGYALVVPVIGGLGGFLTASNAASNALFMPFQMTAAAEIGMPSELAAASQNAAGSNMTMASPGRLVFAATVAGRPGGEAELLWRVLPLALAGLLSAVVMTWLLGFYL